MISKHCYKIFTHKHLDPECIESGCQSLFLAELRKENAHLKRQRDDLQARNTELVLKNRELEARIGG